MKKVKSLLRLAFGVLFGIAASVILLLLVVGISAMVSGKITWDAESLVRLSVAFVICAITSVLSLWTHRKCDGEVSK